MTCVVYKKAYDMVPHSYIITTKGMVVIERNRNGVATRKDWRKVNHGRLKTVWEE